MLMKMYKKLLMLNQ